MYLRPDLATFQVFPWTEANGARVGRLICDIANPDGSPFAGCPRTTLKTVIAQAADRGFTMMAGPETEFFLFLRRDGRATTETHDRASYFDLAPIDLGEDVRREIVTALEQMGIGVEAAHHEVAPGQHEIDFHSEDVLTTADYIRHVSPWEMDRYLGVYRSGDARPLPGTGLAACGLRLESEISS